MAEEAFNEDIDGLKHELEGHNGLMKILREDMTPQSSITTTEPLLSGPWIR